MSETHKKSEISLSSLLIKSAEFLLSGILKVPLLWDMVQFVSDCNTEKQRIYKSVFKRRSGRLLDFGCADGNTFPAFTEFEYCGVDINGPMIERARKKYGSIKNAKFINADILDGPFPPSSFDFVLFACAGHHLADDALYSIMDALGKILVKDGRLYFFDIIHNPPTETSFLKLIMRLDQGKFIRDEKRYRFMLPNFPEKLKLVKIRKFTLKNTFMPQPKYLFMEFKKI